VARSGWSLVPAALKKRGAAVTAGGAALVLAAGVGVIAFASPGSHAAAASVADRSATHKTLAPAAALTVQSITPSDGAKDVNGTDSIRVQFSAPLAASTPMPTLSPSIAGTWSVQGDAAVFTPAVGFLGSTKVTVTIPSGAAGMISAGGVTADAGGTLSSTTTDSFTTGSFSTLRLQQLLAQLGYLPLTWTPSSGTTISATDAKAQLAAAYDAPAGSFSFQSGYPSELTDQWSQGSYNMLEKGAIWAFEYNQNLNMDGEPGPQVWSALLNAVAKNQRDTSGYTYALADQNIPETLRIWHNGSLVLDSPANTGIPASPTVDGTFPVYSKFYFTYMKGNNPDGTPYDDPVYYVSYFNGGDAVHYFSRGSYGFNQSLGCVELPWDSAAKAYPYLTYGSLVTVEGPVGG
jgi:hypothetical protein